MQDLPVEKCAGHTPPIWNGLITASCVRRNVFYAWLGLLFADGGKAAVYEQEGRFGYALYYEEKDKAEVFELVTADDEICKKAW